LQGVQVKVGQRGVGRAGQSGFSVATQAGDSGVKGKKGLWKAKKKEAKRRWGGPAG